MHGLLATPSRSRATVARGAAASLWPAGQALSQQAIIFRDCSQMSCSVQWWISSGSSENRFRISCLAFSVFRLLRNQQTYVVSSIWRVIVISDTGLSASQAMPFPHGDLSINQDLIGIVENPVQDRLGNGAALIRIWMEPFIPVPRLVLCAEDHGSLIAPGLNYFQQTIGFLRRQAPDQPFVQNQQIIFLVRFNKGCSGRKIFT